MYNHVRDRGIKVSNRGLIIHGWCHSRERYLDLASKIDIECDVVDLPGFGDSVYIGKVKFIELVHISYIRDLLLSGKYDVVIAHSWGCRVLLKAMKNLEGMDNITCILLNPIYGENTKIKRFKKVIPLVKPLLCSLRVLPKFLTRPLIKVASLGSINKWDKIDEVVVNDVFKSDPEVACKILYLIATTRYRLSTTDLKCKLCLVYTDEDRVIPQKNFKQLIDDLHPKVFVKRGIGHTLVVEDFDYLCDVINIGIRGLNHGK